MNDQTKEAFDRITACNVNQLFRKVDALQARIKHLEDTQDQKHSPEPVTEPELEPEPIIDWTQHLGRLILQNTNPELFPWEGPYVLTQAMVEDYEHAANYRLKFYQGPTKPNWIEWKGGKGYPEGVMDNTIILVKYRLYSQFHDVISAGPAKLLNWSEALRYTILEG